MSSKKRRAGSTLKCLSSMFPGVTVTLLLVCFCLAVSFLVASRLWFESLRSSGILLAVGYFPPSWHVPQVTNVCPVSLGFSFRTGGDRFLFAWGRPEGPRFWHRRMLRKADAVVFFGPTAMVSSLKPAQTALPALPFYRHMVEPPHYFKDGDENAAMAVANISYKLSDDVPDSYIGRGAPLVNLIDPDRPRSKMLVPQFIEDRSRLMDACVFVAKNKRACRSPSGRERFVRDLRHLDLFPVEGISECEKTTVWPSDISRSDKLGAIKRYRFYIAGENTIDEDYVTEKVYDGLLAGCIPIYIGAPNVKEFVPEHSIIDVADFPSVEALGNHLVQIIKNETLFFEYHQWRWNATMTAAMKEKMEPLLVPWQCRLASYLHGLKNGKPKSLWNKKRQTWDASDRNNTYGQISEPLFLVDEMN